MDTTIRWADNPRVKPRFVCPIDRGGLRSDGTSLTCVACGTIFPVVRGTPVLINDDNSVFHRADYTKPTAYQGASGYAGTADTTSGLRRAYRKFARKLSEAEVPGSSEAAGLMGHRRR